MQIIVATVLSQEVQVSDEFINKCFPLLMHVKLCAFKYGILTFDEVRLKLFHYG